MYSPSGIPVARDQVAVFVHSISSARSSCHVNTMDGFEVSAPPVERIEHANPHLPTGPLAEKSRGPIPIPSLTTSVLFAVYSLQLFSSSFPHIRHRPVLI